MKYIIIILFSIIYINAETFECRNMENPKIGLHVSFFNNYILEGTKNIKYSLIDDKDDFKIYLNKENEDILGFSKQPFIKKDGINYYRGLFIRKEQKVNWLCYNMNNKPY